jgi:hypothetical protein
MNCSDPFFPLPVRMPVLHPDILPASALTVLRRAGRPGEHGMPAARFGDWPGERQFARLRAVFRRSGGVARADDLGRLLADGPHDRPTPLPALLAQGRVLGFAMRRVIWVPMFQFDLGNLTQDPAVGQVLAELDPDLDGWQRAVWFASPNAAMAGRCPVAAWPDDWAPVQAVARTDRWVTRG